MAAARPARPARTAGSAAGQARPATGSAGPAGPGASVLDAHLAALAAALLPYRRAEELLARWGGELAHRLAAGGRLLVAGNGGSAAEAQHLTAELVGKLRDDREPLSALALHAETSALTAIGNDYGYDEVFARQVRAHGRPDDILLLMSTSGASANLVAAAHAGREAGLRCWAFTGPAPNPLADACHDTLAIASPDSQVVQELHLVSTHVLCEYVDRVLPAALAAAGRTTPATGAVGRTGPAVAGAAPAAGAPDPAVRAGVEVVLDDGTGRQTEAG
ncbi:D-sedoheptulose-7-phosphate isomerase [Micromonospora carbonacea]|uniref:D-sedoheptulose-7-phosphate isomerase n=1 Tax=Micromonospora carbonacea TaxID=47853 RepID=UPI003D75F4BD